MLKKMYRLYKNDIPLMNAKKNDNGLRTYPLSRLKIKKKKRKLKFDDESSKFKDIIAK